MNLRLSLSLGLLAAGALSALPAHADPVAIVEKVEGVAGGLKALDYLSAGRAVPLGSGGEIVIDYFHSCVRESVHGGTVTPGKDQGRVAGGSVTREPTDCDRGGRAAGEETAAPGFVPPPRPEGQPHELGIERTLYGTSPLFDMGSPGKLTIVPLDPKGAAIVLDVGAAQLIGGRFYDFAAAGKRLEAGGLYRAEAHGRAEVFWIDPLARDGTGPPVGRLVKL